MKTIEQQDEEMADALTISIEKIFFIIVKAREFDEKVAPSDPESGSNPSDDKEVDVLEAGDDATLQELQAALTALNVDEQLDLVGLMWFGRGDFGTFADARQQAADITDKHIPRYLVGTPQLGDYLEEGLATLGISLESFEIDRL
jgi:hypothetical protein